VTFDLTHSLSIIRRPCSLLLLLLLVMMMMTLS